MKSAVTTAVTIILLFLLAPLAAAKSPDYYLNHPDPEVRQEFMDRMKDFAMKEKIENYERDYPKRNWKAEYWKNREEEYGTTDRDLIRRLMNIDEYGTNAPDEIEKIKAQREIEREKDLAIYEEKRLKKVFWENFWTWTKVTGIFGAFGWFCWWVNKGSKELKAKQKQARSARIAAMAAGELVEEEPKPARVKKVSESKADKTARRKLEKEKILAGESLKKSTSEKMVKGKRGTEQK